MKHAVQEGPVHLMSAADRPTPSVLRPAVPDTPSAPGLPGAADTPAECTRRITLTCIDSILRPYIQEPEYLRLLTEIEERFKTKARTARQAGGRPSAVPDSVLEIKGEYGPHLMAEVHRYAEAAASIAYDESFDLIHVHDWMAIPAGLAAREASGKPLVVHIHSLEFDRSGENVNENVRRIEQLGMEAADSIVAVSHYTRNAIVSRYGIDPARISVVHNAVSQRQAADTYKVARRDDEKVVLFLGRITFQKGPDYFIEAAGLVAQHVPEARFVVAGTGDMLPRIVARAAALRIGNRVHFTGFLSGQDVERMYASSDLYVMPSVSEPFGISPLEAMLYDVPVIVSRQAGVTEILRHALKVDFWNVRDLADKMIAILRYPTLSKELTRNCREELKAVRWENSADALSRIYSQTLDARRS
jgi:glycosyltransferase involved in cell wall biosynthesis